MPAGQFFPRHEYHYVGAVRSRDDGATVFRFTDATTGTELQWWWGDDQPAAQCSDCFVEKRAIPESLSDAEYSKFESQRKRLEMSVVATFLMSAAIGVMDRVLHFKLHVLGLFIFAFACTVATLIQAFRFKCPRCGETPMLTRASGDFSEVQVTRMIALRPKSCHKCLVPFAPPSVTKERIEDEQAQSTVHK
jgi:DNA-directed RNA polymerase subunit M/transcription elongation factor TFIIS